MPSRRQQAACKSCAMACAGRAQRAEHGGIGRLRPILLVLMLHGGGGAVGAVAAAGAGTSVPALRISGGGLPGYSMLTDESVSLRRGIGRIPQPSDLVPPAVFVDVPAAPPSDLAPPAASMDTASPPPPPPSPPPQLQTRRGSLRHRSLRRRLQPRRRSQRLCCRRSRRRAQSGTCWAGRSHFSRARPRLGGNRS